MHFESFLDLVHLVPLFLQLLLFLLPEHKLTNFVFLYDDSHTTIDKALLTLRVFTLLLCIDSDTKSCHIDLIGLQNFHSRLMLCLLD